MTTGSITFDDLHPTPGGLSSIGSSRTTTWTGGDMPPEWKRRPRLRYSVKRAVLGSGRVEKFNFSVRDPSDPPVIPMWAREHGYSKSHDFFVSTPIQLTGDFFSNRSESTGMFWPNRSTIDLLGDNERNALVARLWEKVRGSDFNLGTTLGEGHQALKLIGDSATRIARSLFFLRKGQAKASLNALLEGTTRASQINRYDYKRTARLYPNFKDDASVASRLYLEFRYGWEPLLKDTKAAAEHLAEKLEVPAKQTYKVKRTIKSGPRYKPPIATWGPLAHPGVGFQLVYLKWELPYEHKYALKYYALAGAPPEVAQLGLLDPAAVAWELLPFSFVADWFLPIGPWLETVTASRHLDAGFFVISDVRKLVIGPPKEISNPSVWSGDWSHARSESVRATRTISSSAPVARPRLKPLNKVASVIHCANALALVTAFATGKPAPQGIPRTSVF